MPSLSEIADDPRYDTAATAASKSTIAWFLCVSAYMTFFSGAPAPGWLGGAAFLGAGIFVVSVLIAMPLFLLRRKVPRLWLVFVIADAAITIVGTRAAYLWLFSA